MQITEGKSIGRAQRRRTLLSVVVVAMICYAMSPTRSLLVTGFVPRPSSSSSSSSRGTQKTISDPRVVVAPSPTITAAPLSSSSSSRLLAKIPQIDEWEVLKSGAVKGTIRNHPTLPDGYEITTSPLELNKDQLKANMMVLTVSGSKYKLLAQFPVKQKKSKPKPSKAAAPSRPVKAKPAPSRPVLKPKPTKKETAETSPAAIDYDLNGKVVGTGKDDYLLVGKLIRSSSKRSQIYYAYKADADGNPSGTRLTVKLTAGMERLNRENKNYNRVFSKGRVFFAPLQGSASCYMRKVSYCPSADDSPSTAGIPKGLSALILESGDQNLRTFLSDTEAGLSGRDLRKACVNICRCLEAMHSSGLVWTDLKAENFVLVSGKGSNGGEYMVKGIDLESAVPVGKSPQDYSPEACPPEFAAAEKVGAGYEFQCKKDYDTWSLGMLLYELATGRNYFRGKGESAILNLLATGAIVDKSDPSTVTGLDAIEDDNFRDLVKQCLSIDPKKRPSILQIMLHPYFISTGLGPLSY
eukprot:CAMPEP_0197174960 /NCGR_PEP_ID=MMETSP1423-20130617/1307_1 /TAXON_ID=476441 /ORGANISM="Pseudo-nitzschia heimii, Strain UNC1101" /LENGTH=523 /DNA_ID=CAMNT_0042623993 /DNA_START=306 /DNA_END=1877 /DNA_ORIENTATION=+